MLNKGKVPSVTDLLNQASALHGAGRLADAAGIYTYILSMRPNDAVVNCNLANVLADLGRLDEALAHYDRAIVLNPRYVDAHDFRGIVLAVLNRLDEALASLDRAIALQPRNVNALGNRGNVLMKLDRPEAALDSFRRALALFPGFTAAHLNCGDVLLRLGRPLEAVEAFDTAIGQHDALPEAHFGRGVALANLQRFEEAMAAYRRAIELDPRHAKAWRSLADVLAWLGRSPEAADHYGRALAIDPDDLDVREQYGKRLMELRRFDLAVANYTELLRRQPDRIDIRNDLGVALRQAGRPEDAIAQYSQVLAHDPNFALAYRNRGGALKDLGLIDEAIEDYDRAIASGDPLCQDLRGTRLFMAMSICRWDGLERELGELTRLVSDGQGVSAPFPLLGVVDDPMVHLKCAETFAAACSPPEGVSPFTAPYPRRDRIRVGYFSADFHDHATMHLLLETLEARDRSRFELIGFSFGPETDDPWRRRTQEAFDRFISVAAWSNGAIVEEARRSEIDIAVDLKGYTKDNRREIFSAGCAPLQVSFLGYPGTMGASFMDYLIADEIVIPQAERNAYAESIAFVPGSYQPNCRLREVADYPITRADLGVPEDAFVYCSFNQTYKITPDVFARWMEILKRVEGSVLLLMADYGRARDNLRRRAESQGVKRDRLIFVSHVPTAEHLNRLRLADLFLDTSPCNAHTTASDALRMGLPILTCTGRTFAGRVAASLLHALELPELATGDLDDYEALAVSLATDRESLAALGRRLSRNVETHDLFDGRAFARKLEQAYLAMYDRSQAGLAAADIHMGS